MIRGIVAALIAVAATAAGAAPAARTDGDLGRLLERARVTQARVQVAEARWQREGAAQQELARLNEDIAVRVLGQLSLGRTDGLAAFARAVEGERAGPRRAYAAAWGRIEAGLKDPAVRRAVSPGDAAELASLEGRIARALGGGGTVPVGAVQRAPAPAAFPVTAPPPPGTVHVPAEAAVARVESWSFVPTGAPAVVVGDFTERGYRTAASLASADLLARALADTGRYRVVRAAGAAGGGGYLIDAEISGIRAFASPGFGYYSSGFGFGSGFGRGRGGRRFYYPYNYSNEIRYALDARVRVTDLASRTVLAEKTVSGYTTQFYPGGYYGGSYASAAGGPAAQVLDQAVLDKRGGALRFVLDTLPVQGRIVRVDAPNSAVVEVPSARSVRGNDRFVVIGAGGQEGAILRAREALSETQLRVSVSGKDDDDPPPPVRVGEAVVSRGF